MTLSEDLKSTMLSITKEWKHAKRKADRDDRIRSGRLERMRYRPPSVSIREAAFRVMERAYNMASTDGMYYATARQIMYKARPLILEITDKNLSDNFDTYFTQTLLKDYVEDRGKDNWKVVWDARGHLIEPHTNKSIGLGGIDVGRYCGGWHHGRFIDKPTISPEITTNGHINRFKNVLFIEKEGFTEVLQHAKIPERYDMALMSTKGIPNKAACDLIERLEMGGVRIFVLHDFDYDGFKIARTLREGTRMASGADVIDIGLRLWDIEGLESEPVHYSSNRGNVRGYLRVDCDATPEEADFLVDKSYYGGSHSGRRVELNAMTSKELIDFLEKKFTEHEVEKLIPDQDVLIKAYKRAINYKKIEEILKEFTADENIRPPENIAEIIEGAISDDPSLSWDQAIWQYCQGNR